MFAQGLGLAGSCDHRSLSCDVIEDWSTWMTSLVSVTGHLQSLLFLFKSDALWVAGLRVGDRSILGV